MAFRHLVILAIILSACHSTLQSSPYSLQSAVEALSEREAQIALRDELQNENLDNDDFDDYVMERGQHSPSNALERYFSRSNPDYEDYYGYRKRALLRKRGTSVFRERSRLPPQQTQLAEKFLRAIEEEREHEREEEYREELHKLWNRYQKEENGVERELFNDSENNDIESDYPINYDDKKKKRQRGDGEGEVAPVYWNDKRSMPLLPWLPASRKKRFPVTKRSPKTSENELAKASIAAVVHNNEKIAQDLKGIFGAVNGDNDDDKKKKKRALDQEPQTLKQNSNKPHPLENADKKRNLKKRSPWPETDDDSDEENDNEEKSDDGPDEDTDYNDSSEEDNKKKKKKKREAAKKSIEVVGAESFPDRKEIPKKKSLQWSNLFGLDRKKKSNLRKREWRNYNLDFDEDEEDTPYVKPLKIPNFEVPNDENDYEDDYIDDRRKKKKRGAQGLIFHPLKEIDENYDDDKRKKKRSKSVDRLDAMDEKLSDIRNLIIDDTARYLSHHDDNLNPSELRSVRSELADRLATAYSLDKMRKAISRLKQSMALQRTLERNLLESSAIGVGEDDDKKKAKRVAVKKEKVEFDNNDHEIDSPEKKLNDDSKNGLNDDEDDKKKKKRSQKKSIMAMTNEVNDDVMAPMSEGYMGGKVFREQNDCPLLNAIEKRCRGIDLLTGDTHHNLLEACGAHQLCYLCGDSETQCDYGYLYEIQDTCGHNSNCKLNGAQALKALRSYSGIKVGPRECIRNPCLNSALRSLGY